MKKRVSNKGKNVAALIEKIDHSHYFMEFGGDYGFNEYFTKGVKNLDEYLTFVERKLLIGNQNKSMSHGFGCAAFLAQNLQGDYILGRNMDCECGIGMVVTTEEDHDYESLSLVNMSNLVWEEDTYDTLEKDAKFTLAAPYSATDGINEHGLGVAVLSNVGAVYQTNNETTLLDYSIPRLLLNQAKDIDEAIDLIRKYNLFFIVAPFHFMIADEKGHSAIVEFVDGQMVVLRNQCNYQVVTNFTVYNNPDHEGFGKDRYERIEARLKESDGKISEEDALELLKKNAIPGDAQWSAVYNLTKRSIQVIFSSQNDKVYEYRI